MKNTRILILLIVFLLQADSLLAEGNKYLIILQAGKKSHEGTARAVHALLYSKELKENGHDVVLLFDGAGTEWIGEWAQPQSKDKLKSLYQEVKKTGVTQVICDFCATAFDVRQGLIDQGENVTSEYQGHPSIAKWAERGYQIVVL